MKKIDIVCTIGPNCINPERLLEMRIAGMSFVRLNGSHSTLEWHREVIHLIRKILPGIPIIFDIPGRKIRTKQLTHDAIFRVGDCIILTGEDLESSEKKIPISYPALSKDIMVGTRIFADDGTLSFVVTKIDNLDIYCKAENSGSLKSRKGINVPNFELKNTLVTDDDLRFIKFAVDEAIDFVGISFVESAKHISEIRKLLQNNMVSIVAKVENSGGLKNLKEICQAADMIMIDRGDLAVETGIYNVILNQKEIIKESNRSGKPVIVATEMLHSMINNPWPTKAEISDITNAIIDGCSAVMLSGETAVGSYPTECINTMSSIIKAVTENSDSF